MVALLSPRLALLWPFGFILAGGLLLTRVGTPTLRLFLLSLSLGAALPSHDLMRLRPVGVGLGPELVTRYQSAPEQAAAWAGVRELVVRNSAGDIRVEGGAGEVALEVVYRQRGRGGSVPRALQADFDEASGRLTLTGVHPSAPQSERRGVRADLVARVPAGVALRVDSRIGEVRAEDLGAAEVEGNVGDVTLTDISRTVRVAVDVGDVRVRRAEGEVGVSTRVGDVRLEFQSPPTAPVLASADVGNVTLTLPRASDVTITARSQARGLSANLTRRTPTEGTLTLGAGRHPVALEARVGEVAVRLR